MQGNLTVFDIKTWFVCSGSYSYNCSGTLRLIVKGPIRLELGQAIQADGIIGLPVRFHPSQKSPSFSPRSFTRHHNSRGRFPPGHTTASHRSTGEDLHKQGIHAVLRVPFANRVQILSHSNTPGIAALCMRMKHAFQHSIHRRLPPVAAGIMEAMLLGDKRAVPRLIYNDMIKSGTVHILVVSGFNVGVVAGAFALLLKVIRINRVVRLVIIVPALAAYCIMTGASAPVVRATVMGIFLLFSWYVRRAPSIGQALSMSAFSIIVYDPLQLYNASFQLSLLLWRQLFSYPD